MIQKIQMTELDNIEFDAMLNALESDMNTLYSKEHGVCAFEKEYWIPVTERLPEYDDIYHCLLTCDKHSENDTDDGMVWFDGGTFDVPYKWLHVIAWQDHTK